MEFLREILGDELYAQFSERINAHNGDEANKEKQIKIANLAGGEYVGKGKYDALNETLTGKQTELDAANVLIDNLQKASKGNDEMQGQITAYKGQVEQLQQQLQETKIKSALKVALLSEKVQDVDYLSYKVNEKLREDGKTLELDENENIKGWNDILGGLKTKFPAQFESGSGMRKVLGDNRLPTGDDGHATVTKEQFSKMGYGSRVKLRQSDPELYDQMLKG